MKCAYMLYDYKGWCVYAVCCKGWWISVWFAEDILNNLGISRDYHFESGKDKANMAYLEKEQGNTWRIVGVST